LILITLLEKIKFNNFKCFEDFEINFNLFNVIVGKNNSGKSTIIDAITIISNVIRFAPYRKFTSRFDESADVCILEDRDIPFSKNNVHHNYNKENSIIIAKFQQGREIKIAFPYNDNPYAILTVNGLDIYNPNVIKEKFPSSIGIVPAVGLFEDFENLRKKKYVQSILLTHLMPRHFRNIWYHFDEDFEEFKKLLEATWPSYTIHTPEFNTSTYSLDMYFEEDHISREIFWSGHGLQIWLQLLTFLVKLGKKETLVLDEPDVYLHSDLQKKLIHLCKERANQVIIATHAVDIIEECNPDDIISIDNKLNASERLSTVDDVQICINQIGSYQNLKLVHFLKSKTCLFIEGRDLRYIKKFAEIINEKKIVNEDGFSVIQIGGSSNWEKLKHINWIFRTSLGESIKSYLILDRDYRTEYTIAEMTEELQSKNVNVHIWRRKEIENYAINFEVLYRIFNQLYKERHSEIEVPLSKIEFEKQMIRIIDEFNVTVYSQLTAEEIKKRPNKKMDVSGVIASRYSDFEKEWKDVDYRLKVIPGKEFFACLNRWLGKNYQLSISVNTVLSNMRSDEIDPEVKAVIKEFIALIMDDQKIYSRSF
jgi:predicted ATP-dependent endonuclease of OLD family